ncbi:MAG: ribosomal protein S18-alanine N-acetyltransferase [Vicinamibacterales bacterium]
MDAWIIEPLTIADVGDVLALEEAAFTNPWTRAMYLAELQNTGVSYCFLARDAARKAVGFCSFWRVLDELHINNLAVLPAHRRTGIGSTLLTFVLRKGVELGARRATLEVRRSNEAALELYRRFGFTVAGVRANYYSKPVEDALVLWREDLARLDR